MDLHNSLRSQISEILIDCEQNFEPSSDLRRSSKSERVQHHNFNIEDQFNRFITQFSNICKVFKHTFQPKQNQVQTQIEIGNSILCKLDRLIDVNVKISENLEKVTNDIERRVYGPPSLKSIISAETQPQKYQPEVVNSHLENVFSQMKKSHSGTESHQQLAECQTPLQNLIEQCLIPPSNPLLTLAIPRIFAASSMIHPPESQRQLIESTEGLLSETTREMGQQYINDAEFYFRQYSQARLTYDDMKIKFSESMLYRMINHSEKWIEYFEKSKSQGKIIEGNQREILQVFDNSTKQTLTFLINKYPPSRRKIIDTELTEKIPQIKCFSIAKYDILKNSGSLIGINQKQTDFTKDIKLFLNKIIKQTKSQYPMFKQTMKAIFTNADGSISGQKVDHHQLDYFIGAKLSQSVQPYSEFELNQPGLQIKNSQILRILMKWVEQLQSYFCDSIHKVIGNKFGFKTRLIQGIPIKIPRSKKQKLAQTLKGIYNKDVKRQIEDHKKQMSILIFHLVKLGLAGIQNYNNLNQNQLVMLKLSQSISQVLRSSVISVLSILLQQLVKIGQFYNNDEVQSNIQLVSFGVTDLLRCKCIGSKSQIYRIYNEIIKKKDYFEIIRVKNKLNESTRDILINLKLKKSFLICQVQLSLGDSAEQVNDHFCHYLYELSRSSFGVLFQCANQIWSLDPRMVYLKKNPNIKFKNNALPNQIKSCFRSADFVYCSDNHLQSAMKLQLNSKPYCCMKCSSFHSAYKSWLIHIQCSVCYNSICFTCFNQMKKKNQCLMHKYLKQNSQMNYVNNYSFTQSYFSSIADPDKMINQMKKLFTRYQYVAYIVINNLGNTIAVKKRFKKTFIQAFCTIKQIPQVPICAKLPYHWNAILPLKNPVLKNLNQIKSYRKLHISKKWYEIEYILQQRGITQVICIVDQTSKSVLVIDIKESEQQIEQTLVEREISKNVDEYNNVNCGFFQLTSKKIYNIDFLKNIKKKQTITTLNLWENNIQDISILKQFPNIQQLYLKQNQIKSMEPLLGMKNLTIIGLTRNSIQGAIPVMNFPNLQLMDISYLPELTSLDNLTNSELGSLMMIRANQTDIRSVPKLNLPHLTLLSMAYSNIDNIQKLSDCKLPQLKKLSLNNNHIRGQIPQLSFPSLQYLQLQGNQIQKLQNFSKSQLLNLNILNISNNQIEGQISNLSFPSLKFLNLSGNKITGYNNQLFNTKVFKSLTVLDLSHNHIVQLQQIKLDSLKKLYLNYNKIIDTSSLSSFQLPHLQQLNLSHNQISGSIPCIRFRCLLQLYLQNNKINSIMNLQYSKLPQLTTLNLSNNLIVQVPCLQMQSLKTLNISHNNINSQMIVDCLHLISGNPDQLKQNVLMKKKSIDIFRLQ